MGWVVLESYKQRLAVCQECPQFDGVKCGVCGCYMKAKAIIPYTDCPENKWNFDVSTQANKPEWFDAERNT